MTDTTQLSNLAISELVEVADSICGETLATLLESDNSHGLAVDHIENTLFKLVVPDRDDALVFSVVEIAYHIQSMVEEMPHLSRQEVSVFLGELIVREMNSWVIDIRPAVISQRIGVS